MYITRHVNRYVDNEPRKHGFNYLFEVNLLENLTFIFPLFLSFKCTIPYISKDIEVKSISILYFVFPWRLELFNNRFQFNHIIKKIPFIRDITGTFMPIQTFSSLASILTGTCFRSAAI